MTDVPHFDMPFSYHGAKPAVVEQDSPEDVMNCVEAIVRTTIGDRAELPGFGIEDMAFLVQPLPLTFMLEAISTYEPRAIALADQEPDYINNLTAKVTLQVAQVEEG